MKILVADDNRSIAKKVTEALKDQGCEVVGVAHGEAAVKQLPDFMPDLVLADVFMPVRNGYEVCEYVKNDKRFSHIPVVLLIGAFDPIDQHEVKRVHADGLLKKPFDPPDDLLQMVRTMIEKYQPARAAWEASLNVGDTLKLSDDEMKTLLHEKGASPEEPEPEAQEFAVRPARIEFGEGSEAMPFGELLETPAGAEGPKVVEEGPRETESGFRASSVPDFEMAGPQEETGEEPAPAAAPEPRSWGAMDSTAEESARAAAPSSPEAPPETPKWGGVEVPAKEPTPDEPPIKVEFDSSEDMELVTDETPAPAQSLVDSGPLPDLATSPDEFMAAAASPAAPAESVEAPETKAEPFAIPAMEEVAAPPIAEEPIPPPAPAPPAPALESPSEPAQIVPPQLEIPRAPKTIEEHLAAAAAASAGFSGNTDAFGRPRIDPADMDAIVEKVISRLQKGVLDKITRDILRPIVEALVANEVAEKK